MSREGERLCQCGMALGMPGPPQVKISGKKESVFVHDMPGVVEMVLAVICPCCYVISHWKTDVAAMKRLVDSCEVLPPKGEPS